ncbi:hypothetical protein [uncultured Mediterranean phage]|nr:hypothetical protein [uncultured Mediterranean phage]
MDYTGKWFIFLSAIAAGLILGQVLAVYTL